MASFFISRVDTAVDAALEKIGRSDLQGTTAIDNARLAYARFREIFAGDRWDGLAAAGARVQRPLWASTGTKNPIYSDTLYVDNLIGPDTVNTLPPATLKAFIDHGRASVTIDKDVAAARSRISALADIGISLETITKQLLDQGVAAFAKPFENLMRSLEEKKDRLAGSGNA